MSTEEFAQQQVERIYCAHHDWLQLWLRRKLGSAFDAADIAHDTFVRLLRGSASEPIAQPRAYLVTVAGALVNSHWRRKAIEAAWLETLRAHPEVTVPSPEEQHQALEALHEVSRLLAGLPVQVRECFLLSQLDGLSYAEIAGIQGCSVNVVQKAMTRALTHCYRAFYRD